MEVKSATTYTPVSLTIGFQVTSKTQKTFKAKFYPWMCAQFTKRSVDLLQVGLNPAENVNNHPSFGLNVGNKCRDLKPRSRCSLPPRTKAQASALKNLNHLDRGLIWVLLELTEHICQNKKKKVRKYIAASMTQKDSEGRSRYSLDNTTSQGEVYREDFCILVLAKLESSIPLY